MAKSEKKDMSTTETEEHRYTEAKRQTAERPKVLFNNKGSYIKRLPPRGHIWDEKT